MITTEEFQSLRRVCILSFVEITNLKKLLISHGVIPQENLADYSGSLEEYMDELDLKTRLLILDYAVEKGR